MRPNHPKATGVATNVDSYGVTVSDGVHERTYQIARVPFGSGRILSRETAKKRAIRLWNLEFEGC